MKCNYLGGKWTSGTFTNQNTKKFLEPRLLIVCDPRIDHQALRESSYMNIPTIALCDSDSPLNHVDIAIPCNNKGKQSIALAFWLLCREVLYLKGEIPRESDWEVMVDLFMYREFDDKDKEKEGEEGEDEGDEDEEGDDKMHDTVNKYTKEKGEDEDEDEDAEDDEDEEAWKNSGAADYAK